MRTNGFGVTFVHGLADKARDLLTARQLFTTSKPDRYVIGSIYTDSNGSSYRITRHRHLGIVDTGVLSSPLTLIYGVPDRVEASGASAGD